MSPTTPDLLRHVPPTLLEDLVVGRWLPFVGAGFSRNAVVPDGELPAAWTELGKRLGELVGDLGDASTVEAISAFEQTFGRPDLIDQTSRFIRSHDAGPGRAHLAFAKVGFDTVVTTNFDFLLERGYDQVGKRYLPILDEDQLSMPNRYSGPKLIKMHGDMHHPERLVITEEDYDNFLLKFPLLATSVTALLVGQTTVLIGYSLDDPDTRQLLAMIKSRLGRMARPIWALLVDPTDYTIKRYERRGVKVIALPKLKGRDTGSIYELFFNQLSAFWESKFSSTAESTDDRIAADLQTEPDDSRICFFAIPTRLIGWYREFVFPLVEAHGYVATIARDVVSSPGTALTKVDALIQRASLIVVEVGPDSLSYEASVAVQRSDKRILVISDSRPRHPELMGRDLLIRPQFEEDVEVFLARLEHWLGNVPLDPDKSEAHHLLLNQQYGAAVISAVSSLEVALAQSLHKSQRRESDSRALRPMLREAELAGLLEVTPSLRKRIDELIAARNVIIHNRGPISANDAHRMVGTATELLQNLNR